jgi:hypothetical protein
MFELIHIAIINNLHGMSMWHDIYLVIYNSKVEGTQDNISS